MVLPFIITYAMFVLVLLPILMTVSMYCYTCYCSKRIITLYQIGRWYAVFTFLVGAIAGLMYIALLINPLVDVFSRQYVLTFQKQVLLEIVRMDSIILVSCFAGIVVSYSIDKFFMRKPVTFKQSLREHFPRLLVVSILVSFYVTYMR